MEMYKSEFLSGMSKEMQGCMNSCMMTKNACEQMMMMCMKNTKWTGTNASMMAMQCCMSMCDTMMTMMMCDSKMSKEMAGMCAKMMTMCADECEKMMKMDKMFKMMADMCRASADSCRSMMSSH